MSADESHMLTRAREVTAEEYAAQVGLARGALSVAPVALKARETRTAPVTQPPHRYGAQVRCARVVDDLITELGLGRIRRVAFVVLGESAWTLPLYEVAITTARRGWSIGIADARYWFVTSEPVPLAGFGSAARAAVSARLEPEGITFIGSTFADLRPNVVLLDPQGELLRVDRVVTLSDAQAISWSSADGDHGTRSHSRPAASRRFSDAPREAPPAMIRVSGTRAPSPRSCPAARPSVSVATSAATSRSSIASDVSRFPDVLDDMDT
jgi:hypothetical protein